MTVHVRLLPERTILGQRLGRHVEHDERSRDYPVGPASGGSILHRRRVPDFDQRDLGSCHDSETEILTSSGWLPFPDLTLQHKVATVDPSTRELTFEHPVRVIQMSYEGPVHAVSNKRHDFRVTPDHTMLVKKWDERERALSHEFTFTAMRDVGWYAGLMGGVCYHGEGQHNGTYEIPGIPNYKRAMQRVALTVPVSTWLRFLGIYLAEGTLLAHTHHGGYKVQIAATKPREKSFVRRVLSELGIHATELRDRFTFQDARVWRHLESLGLKGIYASEKFVPAFVFTLPGEDIKAFLEGHREGDGSFQQGIWTHHTSSPQLADDIQRLVFLAGAKTGVSVRLARTSVMRDGRRVVGRGHEYAVRHLLPADGCIERKKDVRVEHYSGMVYCAEVPTHHTLVTRRNGKILIAGNCTGNAMAGALSTLPFMHRFGEPTAVRIYSEATQVDDITGTYPPDDTGSSGLAVLKVAKTHGWISSYRWCFSIEDVLAAIQQGPLICGITWLTGCDEPDKNGLVRYAGTVRGGHEIEVRGYDAINDEFRFSNSWGTGWTTSLKGDFLMSRSDFAAALENRGDCALPLR